MMTIESHYLMAALSMKPPLQIQRTEQVPQWYGSQTVYTTKGTRAHTHRELIREWLWEPKGSSLEYI